MKVLVVTHENSLSGANRSLLSLIKMLSDKVNFDILVNNKNGKLIDELRKIPNINIIYKKYNWAYAHSRSTRIKKLLRLIIDGTKYYFSYPISSKLIKELKKDNYDLVYSNTSTIDFGYRLSRQLSIPHVWHIREFGKTDFDFQKLRKRSYYETIYSESEAIIFISKALQKEYEQNNKFNSSVIYNGFNVEQLKSKIKKETILTRTSPVNIIVTGQVSPGKGQDQAIKACEMLIKEGYNIRLNIFGEIDYDYLKRTVPNFEKFNWLKLHGQVTDIFERRNNMDIELVCSKNEAFGRVTIEAMLHELPVIGSNTGGTAELIKSGETGILFETGDIKSLASKIKLLINDNELRVNIINSARRFAEQFTIEKTSEELYEVFNDVIFKKGKK